MESIEWLQRLIVRRKLDLNIHLNLWLGNKNHKSCYRNKVSNLRTDTQLTVELFPNILQTVYCRFNTHNKNKKNNKNFYFTKWRQ